MSSRDSFHRILAGHQAPRVSRRDFLVGTAALGLTTSNHAALRAQETAVPVVRPNFILIVCDDLDAASVEWMPNITSLLREQGTSFANYFVTDPSCGPSRASLLRGQYVHNHGVLSNEGELGGFSIFHRLGRENSTIATWLQDAGYRTALIGKYLNDYPNGVEPDYVPPGWDDWYGLISTQYTRYKFNDNGHPGRAEPGPAGYQTDVLSRKAQDFIAGAAASGDPFFAYIAPKAPHGPATPPPRHIDAFADVQAPRSPSFNEADVSDKPGYVRKPSALNAEDIRRIDTSFRDRLRTLLAVDDLVGDLIETLRSTDTLDTTHIFFTSDNGHFFGEHRLPTGKGLPYNESLRVSLIVRGPGVGVGQAVDSLVNSCDLAPTIGDLAGATVPDFVDGRSLAPLLRSEMPAAWRQVTLVEDIAKLFKTDQEPPETHQSSEVVTSEVVEAVEAVNEGDEGEEGEDGSSSAKRASVPAYRALRSTDWLYVEYATGERELYDERADPYQLSNLAATADTSDTSLMERFSERLQELSVCTGAGCRVMEDVPLLTTR